MGMWPRGSMFQRRQKDVDISDLVTNIIEGHSKELHLLKRACRALDLQGQLSLLPKDVGLWWQRQKQLEMREEKENATVQESKRRRTSSS